jgi:hypothetical protein
MVVAVAIAIAMKRRISLVLRILWCNSFRGLLSTNQNDTDTNPTDSDTNQGLRSISNFQGNSYTDLQYWKNTTGITSSCMKDQNGWLMWRRASRPGLLEDRDGPLSGSAAAARRPRPRQTRLYDSIFFVGVHEARVFSLPMYQSLSTSDSLV